MTVAQEYSEFQNTNDSGGIPKITISGLPKSALFIIFNNSTRSIYALVWFWARLMT